MKTLGSKNSGTAGIMIHGRGASAQSILTLSQRIGNKDIYYIAPQAETREWYPKSFLKPIEENQPELNMALETVDNCIKKLQDMGFRTEDIFLLGFSQGACLATEYAARNPQKFKAVIGLSGGLIGPEEMEFSYSGNLDSTPIFLGCSEHDPHIPKSRVEKTADVLEELSGNVTKRIYPGSSHRIFSDEIEWINFNI